MKKKCILVDLDGTLANIEHRRLPFSKDRNWKNFNSSMALDTPNHWCREIIDRFYHDHEIILVTGREKTFDQVTLDWLKHHGIRYHHIYFRPAKDYRGDDIIKREIYLSQIMPHYQVLFVLDDRQKVTKMWRSEGLVCLQCDEGNF